MNGKVGEPGSPPGTASQMEQVPLSLDEDDIREEVVLRAVKSVIALQLQQATKGPGHHPRRHGVEMETSRAQLTRVLDPDASNVTLAALSRAARMLGHLLKVELV